MPYQLSDHVHLCRCGEHVILLDLRRDRYLALDEPTVAMLGSLIQYPLGALADLSPDTNAFAAKMLDEGILTTDVRQGRSCTPLLPAAPDSALLQESLFARPHAAIKHAARLMRAVVTARVLTSRESLESNINRVRLRKRLHDEPRFDVELAQELINTFWFLQPFVLKARNECLFQSFVLVELFQHYRLFPTWIFGVRTSPFRAHCWLQHEHMVINDVPENVRLYTPIMAI